MTLSPEPAIKVSNLYVYPGKAVYAKSMPLNLPNRLIT
jgi:hypothetical protein